MAEFCTETGKIFYEVFEAQAPTTEPAPTLTLLHNFMSTGRTAWGSMLPVLTQSHRVLLADAPGHGRSIGYPPAFDHRQMATQLAALMRAEGASTGHLAGCSAGGMIAQLMVQHELAAPASLTLVSTTYSVNPHTTGNTAEVTPEKFQFGHNWMDATARLHDPHQGEGYFFETLLPAFRALNPATAIDLSLADLSRWKAPVCLIHGAHDEFFPAFIPQQMAQVLPNATLHLEPEQTHAFIFRQAWKVRDLMVTFLNQLPR
ncbi:MAG: alpha/beta hydrolase [Caldilineaceae bacterium]